MPRRPLFVFCLLLAWLPAAVTAERLPLFDAHLHYDAAVEALIPPARALELLDEAGIERALVSATPGPAVAALHRAAPGRVVPFLRPYFTAAGRNTWFRDPAIVAELRAELDRLPYRGIGEFHVNGSDAGRPPARAVVRLARERGLALHAHTDLEGLGLVLAEAGDAVVIWAHAGFDVPVPTLQRLLERHPRLYLELSFREGMTEAGRLTPEWRRFLTDHPRRFLVGTDTYTPTRWAEVVDLADEARAWLAQLPVSTARAIARENAAHLFGD